MRLDIHYLDTFLAVCDMEGVANASEHLHLTQPAISYRIKILERQLKVQLFERRGKKLILTDAGKRLRDLSRKYLEEISSIYSDFLISDSEFRETLRIGAVSGFGRYILFPILNSKNFQHIRMHLTYPTAGEIFSEIERGEYELGFVYQKKTSSCLKFRKVYDEELVLITPSDMKLKKSETQKLNFYESIPFVTYIESDYVFGRWFDIFFEKQPKSIASIHHFQELEEVVCTVANGQGISIIPSFAIPSTGLSKKIKFYRPFKQKCINQVYAVARSETMITDNVKNLLKQIMKNNREKSKFYLFDK